MVERGLLVEDPDPEEWAFDYWTECGFHPLEALALVASGLSPSEHREFMRHHPGCSARDAVAILA